MKKKILVLLAFTICIKGLTQGPELLVQQYNRYPYDLTFFRKWNADVFVQPHFTNTSNRLTNGRLHVDTGVNIHRQFTKSFGLSTGVHYNRFSYLYTRPDDLSIDRIQALRFPLLISVFPINRIRISLGGIYHWILKATGKPPPATERLVYPEGTFLNSLGMQAAIHYRFWRKFSASVTYRFQKRSVDNPFRRETQNFEGIALGFHYTLLHPHKSNP